MKIYTKQGDAGETSLWGGIKVPKDDLRIRTYGTLDELNAVLGMVLSQTNLPQGLSQQLLRIQGELFQLGAELATPRGKTPSIALIEPSHVQAMEGEIDQMERNLSPLKNFILPGGSFGAGILHFARTVSRRAERELISMHRTEPQRPVVLQYLNRLSDYLFVAARFASMSAGVKDIPWNP